jgi:hypothetical protein
VNLVELLVENARHHYALAFEAMHQIGAVEPEDVLTVFARRQDEIAAEMLDADSWNTCSRCRPSTST